MDKYPASVNRNGFTLGGIVTRAFVAAHLYTAHAREAERATVEGIDSWNCDEETGSALLQKVLTAAIRSVGDFHTDIGESEGDRAYLPIELRRVIRLPTGPRHCFVLHVLAALPLPECARLLHLPSRQVVERLSTAYRGLSILGSQEDHNYDGHSPITSGADARPPAARLTGRGGLT